jgi:flagellar motor protein MotB
MKRLIAILMILFPIIAVADEFDSAVSTYEKEIQTAKDTLRGAVADKNLADLASDKADDEMKSDIRDAKKKRNKELTAKEKEEEKAAAEKKKKEDAESQSGTADAPAPGLTKEQSDQKIDELRENAQALKDKEQSVENRTLGAAAIGATGIGAMNAMSGLAEQSADAAAERDMRAYLATFRCNYGGGTNVRGGETDVMLPGGNDLTALWTDYIDLAGQLKETKESLGMRAGIESEIIIDKANSGLYDNAAIGKVSGGYTSLARALMDPTGADAVAWAQQTSAAKDKTKTGMITAAAGIGVGVLGNLALNTTGDDGKNIFGQTVAKNRADEINAKYANLAKNFKAFEQNVNNLKPAETCPPNLTSGGTYPNCTCADTDARFSENGGNCVKCPGDLVYDDNNNCKCPNGKVPSAENKDLCITLTTMPVPDVTGIPVSPLIEKPVIAIPVVPAANVDAEIKAVLSAESLFASGSHTLTDASKKIIADFLEQNEESVKAIIDDDHCVVIMGHTDRTLFKGKSTAESAELNKQLSERRAQAVYAELQGIFEFEHRISGFGSYYCDTASHPKANDESCRHVDIIISPSTCSEYEENRN